MRLLKDTELFKNYIKNNDLEKIISAKIDQNIGDISPKQIETEMTILKNTSKNSYMPFLSDAISMYENFNGRVRLFNIGSTSSGRVPVPPFIPFVVWRVRNRVVDGQGAGISGMTPTIMMNMFRIGHWNQDENQYMGLNAKTDLYSCLESGVIMYKMLVDGKAKNVFSSEAVLKHFTKIYTSMFSNALIGTSGTTYGGSTFQTDAARFLIAKFFLLYVLEKQQTDLVDDIAYYAVKHFSTLSSLKNFEETADIDYSSLSKFLQTFGDLFFNKTISLVSFDSKWAQMYGEGMILSIEYAPFLLHFLFAAYHGAVLGGSVRLYLRIKDLKDDGLPKLYNAVIAELR